MYGFLLVDLHRLSFCQTLHVQLQIFESNYILAAQTDRHLKLLAIVVVRVLLSLN